MQAFSPIGVAARVTPWNGDVTTVEVYHEPPRSDQESNP
jgi:hypothetical protein